MSGKGVLMLLGGVLLLAGIVLGFVLVRADGVSCGSALRGSDAAYVSDLVDSFSNNVGSATDDCDAKRSTYRPIVWSLFAAGGVLFLVGLCVPGKVEPVSTVA
jgi:hypothetical protein